MIQFRVFALFQRRTADVPEARLRTLGSLYLALLVQAQGGAAPESPRSNPLELLARSTLVVKGVLLILGILSILSWAIILHNLWTLGRARRQSASFLEVFRRSNKFSEVQAVCRSLNDSPLVGLFLAGYAELTAQLRQTTPDGDPGGGANPRRRAGRPILKTLTAVYARLMRATVGELN